MNPKIFVISGPSGVGKSTVISKLLEQDRNLFFSVSVTTREKRPTETDGRDYHFITREKFLAMVERDELMEHNDDYTSDCYGTPEPPVLRALEIGRDVLLDIDPKGAMQVRERRPDAVLIFLAPPSMEELRRRLVGRGDTAPEKIEARLKRAEWECSMKDRYDHVVINDNVDRAVQEILLLLLTGRT